MKVNPLLIEKYHHGECTAEERRVVEEWLFDDTTDDQLVLPEGESKDDYKRDIWNGIETILPVSAAAEKPASSTPASTVWPKAIAAILVAALLAIGFYQLPSSMQPHLIAVDNSSSMEVQHLDSRGYLITVGPKTQAKINYKTGVIDFSGSLLLSPKMDVELIFYGDDEKVSFKMGQTYILLKDKSGRDKMIVVNERNLLDLPPVIQKQVVNEFNI